MTADAIQNSAAAARMASLKSEEGEVVERVARDAGVTRAALMTLGCCLQVGATSWGAYAALGAEARDLGLREEQGQPILSLVDRMTQRELRDYMNAFLQMLHDPPDPTAFLTLMQQYDETQRRDAHE